MAYFGRFCLDKEKDIIMDLDMHEGVLSYVLSTPNHGTGNLITNFAKMCSLPLSMDDNGRKVIRGTIPCYIDAYNRKVYIFRLNNTKTANIWPDGTVELKASVPSISKTLMSQSKDYSLPFEKTVVKTYILDEYKFHSDLHTHMNANLPADLLIAMGIHHRIRYPLYYIRKLDLRCTEAQQSMLALRRAETAEQFKDTELSGRYLERKIDDNTYIDFADLILNNLENAAYNIPRIRASLAVMKDGQAVFTNLEKVYLYRYVFTKGVSCRTDGEMPSVDGIPDPDIVRILHRMEKDRSHPVYGPNTLFEDKLLWTAREFRRHGITYAEISDTTLVKRDGAAEMLAQVHRVMPAVTEETGVVLRFLAAMRRIPLTIIKDRIESDYARENLQVLRAVACDPYVAGSDIVGEEMNDILDLRPVISEIVHITQEEPAFVVRIHAGENDSLRDNVHNSIRCVKEALEEGQPMPRMRIGHGLYTANLNSAKGRKLLKDIQENNVVLEFQITSNVRLNNLSTLDKHPLKQYIAAGIQCVQGTDGGALYGTDSIDEQLCLEKMLGLTREELLSMRRAEDIIVRESLQAFHEKQERFEAMRRGMDVRTFLKGRIPEESTGILPLPEGERKYDGSAVLRDGIAQMPADKVPVVLVGGSFNKEHRSTRVRKEDSMLIDRLIEEGNPEHMFFVIGHRLNGYEKHLLEKNQGRFMVYSFVPSLISAREKTRLQKAGLKYRICLESSAMGIYKSAAYEIFKRRPSVMIALDGNSAALNMIQEAKNARYTCRTYISARSRLLSTKARSLHGYVTVFQDTEHISRDILQDVEEQYRIMHKE